MTFNISEATQKFIKAYNNMSTILLEEAIYYQLEARNIKN